MIIHDCIQGEAEWSVLRAGKVTASEADRILTPEFKARTGETPKTYLYQKTAEAYKGRPVTAFSTWEIEQGQTLEDEARKWFEFQFDQYVMRNAGFCEREDLPCGCSPDALLEGEDGNGGLEIKSVQDVNHTRYLLEGKLPKDYTVQVHFCMYVTGAPWWYFLSYRRGYPKFVLRVDRDESICEKIHAAVEDFSAELKAAIEKLRNL